METLSHQRPINGGNIFDRSFIDSRSLYVYYYQKLPCMSWVAQINMEKVLAYLQKEYGTAILHTFQYSEWDRQRKQPDHCRTLLLMDGMMIEIAFNYCQILYAHKDQSQADRLLKEVSRFKGKDKKNRFSIELITRDGDEMYLKNMDIKKTKLDLDLFYEDDFREVDALIRKRLNKKEDKGIVLLHGLPGSGKTTYLRHLVGTIRKKVLFLSPSVAGDITSPEFMDLLIDNPDSVVVIEDAENIVMDRKINGSSAVSNLLNISDGLLADFLHIQIVCTFNQSLAMVDSALLRQGRLIAQYEFGKLSIAKARRLSDHLGFSERITRPMTIAEISHQGEKDHGRKGRVEVLGFRRHAEVI